VGCIHSPPQAVRIVFLVRHGESSVPSSFSCNPFFLPLVFALPAQRNSRMLIWPPVSSRNSFCFHPIPRPPPFPFLASDPLAPVIFSKRERKCLPRILTRQSGSFLHFLYYPIFPLEGSVEKDPIVTCFLFPSLTVQGFVPGPPPIPFRVSPPFFLVLSFRAVS